MDALLLYRQAEVFRLIGIEMNRGILANWMEKCGQLVQPLINLIHETILAQHFSHMDDKQVRVLNEPNKSTQNNSCIWVVRSTLPTASAVLHYEPIRSGDAAEELLRSLRGH